MPYAYFQKKHVWIIQKRGHLKCKSSLRYAVVNCGRILFKDDINSHTLHISVSYHRAQWLFVRHLFRTVAIHLHSFFFLKHVFAAGYCVTSSFFIQVWTVHQGSVMSQITLLQSNATNIISYLLHYKNRSAIAMNFNKSQLLTKQGPYVPWGGSTK